MPDTELDTTFAKLTLISRRAQEEPKCQFTSLAHLLNKGYLKACYMRLGRDRACGVDNVTWKEYGQNLDANLESLVSRLKDRTYRPLPARRVYIPKNEHAMRPLGLPALEDKIVQKGIAGILETIYEADFLDCSYGLRPGRGCHQAINALDKTIMTKPINHVIEADIKGCFDNISHDWLIQFLEVRIKDPSLLIIIRGPCSIGAKEIGWGRNANRPWDIDGPQTPRTEDPVYDNYYKEFNPTKYNAEEWVRFAKESGMKYMVLIAKHHDGFAQFDSKVSDYNKLYALVYEWPAEGLGFDPLPGKVLSARTLSGAPASFKQSADELAVEVAEKDREKPVTVIELTLDRPLETGLLIGGARAPK